MLADNHRKAAEDIESDITILQSASHQTRLVIEGARGASVRRDGIVLYQRGALPAPFAA